MFDPTQRAVVKSRIRADLDGIEYLGSKKLYICWYDDLLIPDAEWKGVYPCSSQKVSLKEVIDVIKDVMVGRKHIIRHNVFVSPLPVFMSTQQHLQDECEKYVEVCLIQA